MRDPNRLDDFYKRICEIHKEKVPDWRFGQLCSNFFGWLVSEKQKGHHTEEVFLRAFLRKGCHRALRWHLYTYHSANTFMSGKIMHSGVNLRFFAMCEEDDKFQVERDLNRLFKLLFDKNNINIPFPQVTLSH